MSPKLLSYICLAIIVIDCIQATVSNNTLKQLSRIRRSGGSCGECGQALGQDESTLIISGEVVRPQNKYPWVVGLVPKGSGQRFCGASIISDTFILTAAHCLRTKEGEITNTLSSGTNGWCKTDKGKKKCFMKPNELEVLFLDKTRGAVAQIYVLPKYQPHNPQPKDIGMIRLKKPITCGQYKRPICLPEANRAVNQDVGAKMIITGWGVMNSDNQKPSKELREIQVTVMEVEECKSFGGEMVANNQAYCGTTDGVGSPCFGDSGGNLFTFRGGKNIVYGVATAVFSKTCEANKPTMFTAVSKYLGWIKRKMGQRQQG